MSTSNPSVHAFMEMAAGLLLGDRVDGEVRPELLKIAQRSGLPEAEMDEVVSQLAAQGIVTLDDTFLPSPAEAPKETAKETPKETSKEARSSQAMPPELPASHKSESVSSTEDGAQTKGGIGAGQIESDSNLASAPESSGALTTPPANPLARDMFKRRVISVLRSGEEIDEDRYRQLLADADGFGLDSPTALRLLRRWMTAAGVEPPEVSPQEGSTSAVPPPVPPPVPPQFAARSDGEPTPTTGGDFYDPSIVPQASAGHPLPPPPPPIATSNGLRDMSPASSDSPLVASSDSQLLASSPSTPTTGVQFVDDEPQDPQEGIEFVESMADARNPVAAPPPPPPPSGGASPGGKSPLAAAPSASNVVDSPDKSTTIRTPGESYIRYLHKAIPQLRREYISVRSEQGLIAQGAEKLGIGEPYAVQLLREVADQMQMPMLSRQAIEEDPRFDKFRERAASIIAEQRGVNVKSRMLLSALGEELGLSEEELDQAMAQLGGGSFSQDGADVELEEAKQESFRTRLRETLSSMRDSFITAPIENAILDDGVDYEGLSTEAARGVLHEQAAEAGIIVIDKRQAKRHIDNMLAQGSGAAGEQVDLAPLLEEARLWGLADDEFMEIVASHRAERAKQQRRERRITTIALAGSCTTAAAIIWGAVWLMWPPGKDAAATPNETTQAVPAVPTETPKEPDEPSPWTDPELLISLTNARKGTPLDRQSIIEAATSDDPERRLLSIKALAAELPRVFEDRVRRESLIELFKHWFRVEPIDEHAQQLMRELLAMLPTQSDQLPDAVDSYEADFQILAAIVETLTQDRLAADRSQWVAEQLAERLETVVDQSLGWAEVERHCKAELAVMLYKNLIAATRTQEGPFEPHHWALSVHLVALVRPVDAPREEKLQLDFLQATLRANNEPWMPYEELIRRFAYSKNPAIVMQMASLMEDVPDKPLQQLLSNLLLLNIGEAYRGQSVAEVAATVRAHFRGSDKPKISDRAVRFVSDAEDKLKRATMPTKTDPISQQIIDFARLNTMGCAAYRGAAADDQFDTLLTREPKLGLSTEAAGYSSSVVANRTMNESLIKQIQLLKRQKHVPQRIAVFKGICNSAVALRRRGAAPGALLFQPEPEHAKSIAEYITSPKSAAEHEAMLAQCVTLAAWPNLLLAIVDELEKFESREAQVEEAVRALVGGVTIGPGDPWRQTLQQELLRVALDSLQVAHTKGGRSTVTLAGEHLSNYYQLQATFRGVPDQQANRADGPGQVLKALVQHAQQELASASVKDPADLQWLEDLDHLITAAEHAAANDLQRLAMFQRVWLRLLRMELTAKVENVDERARVVERELILADRRSDSVWAQIRDGEIHLTKMWVLYNQEAAP